jgi:hypothetical protein
MPLLTTINGMEVHRENVENLRLWFIQIADSNQDRLLNRLDFVSGMLDMGSGKKVMLGPVASGTTGECS